MLSLTLGLLLAAATTVAEPPVAPGPKPAPIAVSWELDFEYLQPRRMEVQLPGESKPTVYWYLLYTVTNNGTRSQRFFPTFQLVTDDLRVIDTDMGVSPTVFEAIKERHRNTHPYLTHPTKAIGDLMTGDDHALESVAIWRADDTDVNSFKIYAAGLSGEAREVRNPSYDPEKPETEVITGPDGVSREVTTNPKAFVIRKTLELAYRLPGSEAARTVVEPVFSYERWVMR